MKKTNFTSQLTAPFKQGLDEHICLLIFGLLLVFINILEPLLGTKPGLLLVPPIMIFEPLLGLYPGLLLFPLPIIIFDP